MPGVSHRATCNAHAAVLHAGFGAAPGAHNLVRDYPRRCVIRQHSASTYAELHVPGPPEPKRPSQAKAPGGGAGSKGQRS